MVASSPAVEGRVLHINRKPESPDEHGLPKVAVPEALVTRRGVEGDFNRWRHEVKHDDPFMALLIEPQETLDQLNREGWPVRAGDLGENFTTQGIAYDAFTPGRRFRIGEVLVEISKACTPCDNLFLLPYVGAVRGSEFLRTMVNRRGWYARVLEEGRVRTGDRIRPAP